MAGSPTAAWLPKRPEAGPGASASGPRFAGPPGQVAQHGVRATRPFRFGSEDRPDPDPPLGAGSVVGDRYQILKLLGEGGMGRVYEAQHMVLRRRVALKLLRRDAAAEAENLARFRQEALAASRIGAPEIVEVVDFASHATAGGAQTYMVMELLAGESLEGWMDRPGSLADGLTILASLCDGLAAAHRADVVHRDIKPANVFLPKPDPTLANPVRVKILDFGIAKITAGNEGFQTRQGSLLGTPYYLAPERVMGAALTGAADVYSVGVILYEMLTGNVPFVADSFMGILANHVHTPPLDPRQAAPDRPIPDSVARLCLRLLAKQPGERPSAAAVALELRALLGQAGERAAIAAVMTGPRGVAGAGADTQILAQEAEATRALPVDVVAGGPAEHPRSATRIGHASAAVEGAVEGPTTRAYQLTQPSRVEARVEPRRRVGVAIGLVGLLVLLGSAALAWRHFASADAGEPSAAEQANTSSPGEAPAQRPTEPPTTSSPAPVDPAATPVRPSADASETEPVAAAQPSSEGAEPAEPAASATREPRDRSKPSPSPKPRPSASDEPAPKPADPPPQADPPAPKPEPGPELPTITDDVYD